MYPRKHANAGAVGLLRDVDLYDISIAPVPVAVLGLG